MKYFLSMAALALVGAMTVSCSSDDNIIDQPQQPETKSNVVTLTTTVGFDDATGTTRALDINYTAKTLTKTFAVGEQIALIYRQTGGTTAKAVSAALTPGDISGDGKSANFTFELTNPDKTQNVTYIYPAAMAGATGVDWSKLNTQDGTLASIASKLDYASAYAAWNGDALPAVTLDNMLAIIAYTLKDATGANDITSTITGMTIKEGTNTYTITGKDADGHIYAAIQPTLLRSIEYTATAGTKNYTKSVTGKNYYNGGFYQVGLRMTQVGAAVDLGLSVKWANMNVGASSESDFGKYFAWGETTGYDSSDGHSFGWANYSLCGGSNTTMTKYCNKEGYGTVDNKTTLEAADDAATANWGSPWRMPTKAEMQELADTKSNTAEYTWELTTVDGHKGYRITRNSTGANIFLPASGNYGGSLYDQNSFGYYWSSSLDEESGSNPSNSYYLGTNNTNAGVYNWNSRYLGLSVRPVQ